MCEATVPMSSTHFVISLISLTKSQLYGRLCLQKTGHCKYPQWMWEKSLLGVNISKAEPDNFARCIRKTHANLPADVITDIFYNSCSRPVLIKKSLQGGHSETFWWRDFGKETNIKEHLSQLGASPVCFLEASHPERMSSPLPSAQSSHAFK